LGDNELILNLQAVASLNETEIGAYCHQHGIYNFQLKEREQEFIEHKQSERMKQLKIILKNFSMAI
jgi:hypothetical protein